MSDASIQRGSAILKRIRQSLFGSFLVLLGFAVGFRTFEGLNEQRLWRLPACPILRIPSSRKAANVAVDSSIQKETGNSFTLVAGRFAGRGPRSVARRRLGMHPSFARSTRFYGRLTPSRMEVQWDRPLSGIGRN